MNNAVPPPRGKTKGRTKCKGPSLLFCVSELCSRPIPGAPGSHVGPSVPQPWREGAFKRTYALHDQPMMKMWEKARSQHYSEVVQAIGGAVLNRTFEGLRQDGLFANDIGLDLTLVQHVRHAGSPANVLQDKDVKLAIGMLVFAAEAHDTKEYDPKARYQRHLWETDMPLRRPACALTVEELSTPSGPWLQSFLADGYVKIGSVAQLGVDVDALKLQALHALEHDGYGLDGNGMWTSVAPLPALEPLLESELLAELLRGYMGGKVRYDGHYAFKLMNNIELRRYNSGHWHHDRCGRRIRMGILLNDVTIRGRPTEVARGSHNLLYWSQLAHVPMSRISDSYVRSQYEVAPMTGRAGSAFILDTNALHRGNVVGATERSVIFVEFHGHGKVPPITEMTSSIATNMPCPSLKKTWPNKPLGWDWVTGKPGHPLYPPDPPRQAGTKREL